MKICILHEFSDREDVSLTSIYRNLIKEGHTVYFANYDKQVFSFSEWTNITNADCIITYISKLKNVGFLKNALEVRKNSNSNDKNQLFVEKDIIDEVIKDLGNYLSLFNNEIYEFRKNVRKEQLFISQSNQGIVHQNFNNISEVVGAAALGFGLGIALSSIFYEPNKKSTKKSTTVTKKSKVKQ